MKKTALEQKLIAAARGTTPSDHVPYAFEKRIMARLSGTQPLDAVTLWGRALWRAALPCVAATMLVGAWAYWQGQDGTLKVDLSQELESAVLVMADSSHDAW